MRKNFTARVVSLDETYELAHKLALMIMGADLDFDTVIAIARGGMPPSRFICDFLNIKRLTSIQIRHYTQGAQKKEKAEILDVPEEDLKGKSILLIDDVNDTGETLKLATEYINDQQPKLLKTAVLHEKDSTSFEADLKANRLTKWKWLIFQWAVTEDVLEFIQQDGMLEENTETIQQHLLDKYELEVEASLLLKILKLKSNYYGDKAQ
jgi:hypothetical protein